MEVRWDEAGKPVPSERKPLATDRVALTPGRDADVALIRRIYALYIGQGAGDSAIARELSTEGLRTDLDKPSDAATVRPILTSEKCCGVLVFNQTTRKLRRPVAGNPESVWVRCENALAPIVSRDIFNHAQRVCAARASTPDRERILQALRDIHAHHGTINARLCQHSSLPGRTTIHALFGGYVEAYAAAGLPVQKTASGALGIRSRRMMMKWLIEQCAAKARLGPRGWCSPMPGMSSC